MKIGLLINKPENWAKNCLGKDKEGNELHSFDTMHFARYDKKGNIAYQELRLEDSAKSFSIYGAIVKCYSVGGRQIVLDKLRKAIINYTGKILYIAEFNDMPETSFEDVRKVLKMAEV